MDALADILKTVHLTGSLYCRSEASAPWGMELPSSSNAQFHVVRRGRCWLALDDHRETKPILLEAGDIVLLPQGNKHSLTDHRDTPPEPLEQLVAKHPSTGPQIPLVFGGGGERTTLICGYFTFDSGDVHPLFSVLPKLVSVCGEGGKAHRWLDSTLDLISEETTTDSPGGESLINRLTEALFILFIRIFLEEQKDLNPNWLAGLRDPQIARALGLIHHELEKHWTVETLALRVGLSRSGFFAKFRSLVGEPPLQYATRWRMQMATNYLREGRLTLSEIAEATGYQSDASFSKVFKRFVGLTPGAYRSQIRSAP